jgi:hypothetical protein
MVTNGNGNGNGNSISTKRGRRARRRGKDKVHTVVQLAAQPGLVHGFPNRMLTRLRYCDTYAVVSTAGAIGKQIMRWNSCFDPDQTGTGHQPLYFDSYAGVYDHYAVVSATAVVTFVSNAATSAVVVGCVTDDDVTTSTTLTTLLEQNNSKTLLLPSVAGALSTRTIQMSWSAAEMFNIDPFTSETYKTAVSGNPTEISGLLIWAAPVDGSSTTTTQVLVEMEMDVLWTELQTPTQS